MDATAMLGKHMEGSSLHWLDAVLFEAASTLEWMVPRGEPMFDEDFDDELERWRRRRDELDERRRRAEARAEGRIERGEVAELERPRDRGPVPDGAVAIDGWLRTQCAELDGRELWLGMVLDRFLALRGCSTGGSSGRSSDSGSTSPSRSFWCWPSRLELGGLRRMIAQDRALLDVLRDAGRVLPFQGARCVQEGPGQARAVEGRRARVSQQWAPWLGVSDIWEEVYRQACYERSSPVCFRTDCTCHHVKYRAHGGTDDPDNLSAPCAHCHLWGEHEGRLNVRGTAAFLVWLLGRKPILEVRGRCSLP